MFQKILGIFDITAPDDATIENELQAMGAEERSKQAIAMLATGVYMNKMCIRDSGLSIVRMLVQLLEGTIDVDSVPGARFPYYADLLTGALSALGISALFAALLGSHSLQLILNGGIIRRRYIENKFGSVKTILYS